MSKLYVEYALSFGVETNEGLWKMQFLHPYDANTKVQTWIPLDGSDERIGSDVDDVRVAQPGERLIEVMGWLYDRITRYPYYWPKEGTWVDKFGYDFEADITDNNQATEVEITQIAYDILKEELRIKPEPVSGETEVDLQTEKINAGGVLVKLQVTLNRSQPVSELNIAPFTKYPMELVSLMYEEDTETFHPKKEITLSNVERSDKKFNQTTESIRFQFPVVIAKRFTLVIRQQNPEKNTYLVSKDAINRKALWDMISKREADVSLDDKDGLETLTAKELDKISGFDIYIQEVRKYQSMLLKWRKEVDLYRQKQAERTALLQEKERIDSQYSGDISEYREEYNEAIKKYKTKVANYENQLQNYNAAYQKYQKDLKIYNKYLREYGDWKSEL